MSQYQLLDPQSLALPADTDLDAFLTNLLALDALARASVVTFASTGRAIASLSEAQCFPHAAAPSLRQFPQRGDVLRLVHAVLRTTANVEDLLGLHYILTDALTIAAADDLGHEHSSLRDDFAFLISCAALAKAINQPVASAITTHLRSESALISTSAAATMAAIEWRVEPLKPLPLPYTYSIDLTLCNGFRGLCAYISPVDLWRDGNYAEAFRLAVVQALENDVDGARQSAENCKFGKAFLEMLARDGFDHQPQRIKSLLSAMVDIALRRNLHKSHALRTSAGGGAPERIRSTDGAHAMRHDVTQEYHLHYWQVGSLIEFATVGPHNWFWIPE